MDALYEYARARAEKRLSADEIRQLVDAAFPDVDEERALSVISKAVADVQHDAEVRAGKPDLMFFPGTSVPMQVKRGKNGQTFPSCPFNVASILENDPNLCGRLALDRFSSLPMVMGALPWSRVGEVYPRPMTDYDRGHLLVLISERYGMNARLDLDAALKAVLDAHGYNELETWLHSLSGVWDGVPRAAALLMDTLGVQDDMDDDGRSYVRTATTLWLRGAVRRALHPGVQFDLTLILAGDQGIGKSTLLRRLAMRRKFFCEDIGPLGSASAVESLSQSWICCMDELSGMTRTKDVQRTKAFLTATSDDYRAPYSRLMERRLRHCVFAGTSNELTGMLHDASGSRRFIVAECAGGDRAVDIWAPGADEYFTQIWAEIYAMEVAAPEDPLCLPEWAVAQQQARNAAYEADDETAGLVKMALDAHWSADEPTCLAQLYLEMYPGATLEGYRKFPYRSAWQTDVTRIIEASSKWERGGAGRPATHRFAGLGKQRAFWPVGAPLHADDDDESDWDELNLLLGGGYAC